jgi:hypothetical protein
MFTTAWGILQLNGYPLEPEGRSRFLQLLGLKLVGDPLLLLLAASAIVAPAVFFLLFLRFFQKTRLEFRSCITCPEKKQRARVQFITRFGESGPYPDVGSCSLFGEEKEVACKKACLLSREVLETPFVSDTGHKAAD